MCSVNKTKIRMVVNCEIRKLQNDVIVIETSHRTWSRIPYQYIIWWIYSRQNVCLYQTYPVKPMTVQIPPSSRFFSEEMKSF